MTQLEWTAVPEFDDRKSVLNSNPAVGANNLLGVRGEYTLVVPVRLLKRFSGEK